MLLGHTLTYISALISAVVGLFISYLLVKNAKGRIENYWLALWVIALTFSLGLVGSYIIAQTDPQKALRGYQLSVLFAPAFVTFTLFAQKYVAMKGREWVQSVAIFYSILTFLVALVFPQSVFQGVVWDSEVGFYLYEMGDNTWIVLLVYVNILFWLYGSWLLIEKYRLSRSAVERNRLKYLILGSLLPLVGVVLITVPITAIRKYPFDMWGVTLGTALIAYAILRYRLLNISVAIRQGLVYSVLTAVVTGVYLFFALIIQHFLGVSANLSIPAALSTALVIAVIFQPLNQFTQSLIDRLFFRKKYDPQLLIAEYSDALRELVDPDDLAKMVVEIIIERMQIMKGALYLNDGDHRTLNLLYAKANGGDFPRQLALDVSALPPQRGQDDVVGVYEADQRLRPICERLGVALVIPLRRKEVTLGVLLLGEKLSEEAYTLDEYQLLKILADQAAVAFQNSMYVEEIKRGKDQLKRLLLHERELDKIKSEFVSIASHNLRTPLTVIEGYLALLRDNMANFTPADKESLNRLEISVRKLNQITERLLTISAIEQGKVSLSHSKVDMSQLIVNVIDDYREYAKEQGDKLVFVQGEKKIPPITADRLKIKLVLENLIENAIKFTKNGQVEVSMTAAQSSLTVHVKDTGEGVPKDEAGNIFSEFYQAGKSKVATPGMGAGLYISKLIVEAHHGKIWFESKEGVGSTFSFQLPFNPPERSFEQSATDDSDHPAL